VGTCPLPFSPRLIKAYDFLKPSSVARSEWFVRKKAFNSPCSFINRFVLELPRQSVYLCQGGIAIRCVRLLVGYFGGWFVNIRPLAALAGGRCSSKPPVGWDPLPRRPDLPLHSALCPSQNNFHPPLVARCRPTQPRRCTTNPLLQNSLLQNPLHNYYKVKSRMAFNSSERDIKYITSIFCHTKLMWIIHSNMESTSINKQH